MFQLLKYFNKIYLIYSKLNVYICIQEKQKLWKRQKKYKVKYLKLLV